MSARTLRWGSDLLTVLIGWSEEQPPSLLGLGPAASLSPAEDEAECARLMRAAVPLVEIQTAGSGRVGTSGKRHVDGAAARAQRLLDTEEVKEAGLRRLLVRSSDPDTGLSVVVTLTLFDGIPALRVESELLNTGLRPLTLEYVSSAALSGLARDIPGRWEQGLTWWTAANPWSGECRWTGSTLAEAGVYDVGMTAFGQTGSKNRVALTSTGSWSSSEHLPMGAVEHPATGRTLLWQVEHNGSWHAEVADRFDDLYLLVGGPNDREHQWRTRLEPGAVFRTVPAALVAVPDGGLQAALAELTRYRRATRRPHPDHLRLPVIANDFMNGLMGEQTTAALLPLVSAAARCGAEVFCLDAGWFDSEPPGRVGPGGVPGWWDAVGDWRESDWRFPGRGGLREVADAIRAAGMVPGLWLEPEVVGVRSGTAARLPAGAFFRRDGERIAEWGRYHLDLRHPAARAHLDSTVDRLVQEYGLGYLKLDYNIDIGPGTEFADQSAGEGLLGHNRALLDWLESLMDRHPDLVLENCAAGGSRADHAMLSRLPVHSVTDQQDFRLLPAIAAAAPSAVTPEQGAMWAYPLPGHSAADLSTVMVSALLGRIHLGGRPDLLDTEQQRIVREAVDSYLTYRHLLPTALPRWPLGLPGWRDERLALRLDCPDAGCALLAVWHRGADDPVVRVPLESAPAGVEVLFAAQAGTGADWDPERGLLHVHLPQPGSAALLRLDLHHA
ncbi:alpha-galactosidase [Streptomyces sp. 846.5]|nr:glycoside hydrolase family 36 protein [Streptomyces sp. 846.5]TDT97475.1 alpha-galactosidase [Streptomyces sp. 846.5]